MAYEVLAVRYATLQSSRAELYHRHESYGEPDAALEMAYYFWLLRDGDETIVVDCGFAPEAGARRGRTCLCPPLDALRALGVEPETVSTVVVTHLHYDHIGNLAAFPAATLCVPRRELDFWTGPLASRFQFAAVVEPAEIAFVARGGRRRARAADRRPRGDLRRRDRDHGRRSLAGPAGRRRLRAPPATSFSPRTRRTSRKSSSSSARSP